MFGNVTLVAVTTAADRMTGMSAELVATGLQPVPLPCTKVRRGSPDDRARLGVAGDDVDLIVLDSWRPVEILWPTGPLPAVPFAVSSLPIAASVAERGGHVAKVGGGDIAKLVADLDTTAAGLRVAFPHAADTDPRAIAALADTAASLVAGPVYANHPCGPQSTSVDAVVFLSALAVHGWALTRSFTNIVVAGWGKPTRAALERYDRPPDVAGCGTYASLAEALADFVR